MSNPDNANTKPGQSRKFGWSAPSGQAGPSDAEASKRLAHELSNLVDGSLRNLSLAMGRLDEIDASDTDDTNDRLRASAEAMHQMATVLRRFMDGDRGAADGRLHWTDATIGEAIDCAMRMIDPQAAEAHVTVRADARQLRDLPAGPLYPVISNAIKNAVEAIGANGHIDITGSLDGGRATLRIVDNGPGVGDFVPLDADGLPMAGYTNKRGGHGTGLAVSRDIVRSIGASMTLNNRSMGGAVLTVSWDTRSIAAAAQADKDGAKA